jgi:hypothetical protein
MPDYSEAGRKNGFSAAMHLMRLRSSVADRLGNANATARRDERQHGTSQLPFPV